ncbi:MAG: CDGSH iron-sulfur domain-containing protein [Rhizobiales bacterium]|nr:CDGSH iron-sulfur domain-containing protein [Hyphomicrobiales bacterium]
MTDEPQSAQMGPYMVELEAGKRYFFCSCGRSASQPFCDGSHKGTSLQPLAFTPEQSGMFNLCGCKQSDTPPFCDGSHNLY